jgi:aerobic-type carbon monoxide dehydrogenase small subunit (CoxS/CutS family)
VESSGACRQGTLKLHTVAGPERRLVSWWAWINERKVVDRTNVISRMRFDRSFPMPAKVSELTINGAARRVDADADRSLLGVLRDDLDLTGSKYGCGEGRCGACTVLVDGEPVRSCLAKVGALAGKSIRTIEGLESDGKLHPLQQAFLDADALQCGYCTSGMIMAGVGLLERNPSPAESEVIKAMEGNVCRCGTYTRILGAFRRASEAMRGGAR